MGTILTRPQTLSSICALLTDFFGLDVRPTCLTAPVKMEADTRQVYKLHCYPWGEKIQKKNASNDFLSVARKIGYKILRNQPPE